MEPPPLPFTGYQQQNDGEHLKLLAVFHFVLGGLAVAGVGFLILHYLMMSKMFMNPAIWKNSTSPAPPAEFFQFFMWFYWIMGVMFVLGGIANVISGLFIQRRKFRMFTLVVAALNCLQIPFGTVLGIFTIMVLMRGSVRQEYEA